MVYPARLGDICQYKLPMSSSVVCLASARPSLYHNFAILDGIPGAEESTVRLSHFLTVSPETSPTILRLKGAANSKRHKPKYWSEFESEWFTGDTPN